MMFSALAVALRHDDDAGQALFSPEAAKALTGAQLSPTETPAAVKTTRGRLFFNDLVTFSVMFLGGRMIP